MNDKESVQAPDFELVDTAGTSTRLSNLLASRHVVLVFNRGFE